MFIIFMFIYNFLENYTQIFILIALIFFFFKCLNKLRSLKSVWNVECILQ